MRYTILLVLVVLCCEIVPSLSRASVPKHKSCEEGIAVPDSDAMAVNQVEQAGGNNDFVGLNANAIIRKLKDPRYATQISKEKAISYTKKGTTVIVGLEGKPKGHVVEVTPDDMVDSKTSWGMVPLIFNVGKGMQ